MKSRLAVSPPHRAWWVAVFSATSLLSVAVPSQARVTKIVIDEVTPIADKSIPYEQIRGRAFGELDPDTPQNSVITDIKLGTDADGKVRYETNWVITKPVDAAQSSGFLWHDVPNRGRIVNMQPNEFTAGDIGLRSGWQADNAGGTGVPHDNRAAATKHYVVAPIAKIDGQAVTGKVLARIVNQSGTDSKPLMVQSNPMPYLPATLDTSAATLTIHTKETVDGVITEGGTVPPEDWAFATCDAEHPFPGIPADIDPAHAPDNLPIPICLRHGFDADKLYQVVYTASNPYVLGVGMAAFRDVGTFFRYAKTDDHGTANPIADIVKGATIRGRSQSGNMIRQFLFMGLNQDEAQRQVYDGAWPIIAGRRVAANARWAQPDGVLELYQMGSEGAQWWDDWPDEARELPAKGIFTRCRATDTCPKVIEHFGSAEVYALKLTPEWVGTNAKTDIPLPDNVRRYYVPGSTHGGGKGGFVHIPESTTGPKCPGNSYGQAILPANPMPHTALVNVISAAMRDWVLKGTPPPPSRYPTLAAGTLTNPNKQNMGFPDNIPGIPDSIFAPENFAFPIFDYDWGPDYDHSEASGVPTNIPPPIKRVLPLKVPKVDADGNELDGVPTVLAMAPLGTYLGWNITKAGFHKDQVCNYVGGYIPFAKTRAERLARNDPRLSLEERYTNHEGYVAAVRTAADKAMKEGFLLPADHARLIDSAARSTVLR